MFSNIHKIEGWLLKEVREHSALLGVITLLLCFPGGLRNILLFMLIINLLPKEVATGRIKLLQVLPFSRSELFFYHWGLLMFISVATALIGSTMTADHLPQMMAGSVPAHMYGAISSLETVLYSITFTTAYYSIAMLVVSFGYQHLSIPLIIFIMDLFLSGSQSTYLSAFRSVSPIGQGLPTIAMLFAGGLLVAAWKIYSKGGRS